MKVCIVGGGNLGHAYSGTISTDVDVIVLTRRPNDWSNKISVLDENKAIVKTRKIRATSDYSELSNADAIIITLPCTARLSACPIYITKITVNMRPNYRRHKLFIQQTVPQ